MDQRTALAGLAAWLDLTRGPTGYGGPIAHWWRDCLSDCRPGYDWRYEGIILGYLELHARTGERRWLDLARRAGDDLVAAQTPIGHFRRSLFEQNPGVGGTPHEAAAAIGLLRLAEVLARSDREGAAGYRAAAQLNLERCLVERLWDGEMAAFRDDPRLPSFVPNKTCTAIEALLLLAEATGTERYVGAYALPSADAVLRHQVRRSGDRLDGAIAQNSFGRQQVAKYFPYYVARCVPGLLAVHTRARDDRYADAALAAGRFVLRWRDADGAFPQVVYADARVSPYPRWVAAVGDVLRALRLLRPFGMDADLDPTEQWLLRGLLPTGAAMSARGFAAQARGGERTGPPDLRDLLPVAGWTDKAFRYLAMTAPVPFMAFEPAAFEAECQFQGHRLMLRADATEVSAWEGPVLAYRWRVGDDWAEIAPWATVR